MSDETRDPTTQSGGTGTGDFLAQVVRDLGENVRREVEQLRTEARERAAGGAKGAGLLAAAGAAGTVALAALASLPIMALRRLLPGWAIAVLFAGGAGTATVVLARRGLAELGDAAPIDTERVKDAAREAVRPSA
ncbi:MAG TPA: phage holin family protein [Solirubrobacteraceae bacterium]|nr:phage holin family protein [Solirubrobacteraceae bacterium]